MSRHVAVLTLTMATMAFMDGAARAAEPPRVPDGYEVELVATSPLVEHPTMAGFDDQGRLYVCDGPGLNLPAEDLLRDLPNMIRVLEDTDGDGQFDKSQVFADKMTFPMGALWHEGALYVASPPSIWRLRDTDGDGRADERQELVTEFGFTGNAADVHGCFLGPEGRIYWCDGRHGHIFVDKNGVELSKGLAARIFSCRLDGSDVEAFCGGGMDNPVEVTFTDAGEMLGTVAIFDNIEGRHDALVHYVYGGVYPHHECVREFPRTGDLLGCVSRFGQVAPSGVARVQAAHLGEDFVNNVFTAHFNTHAVVRTRLEPDGSTFRSLDEPFLTSDNPDFHPTDVLEDADGTLLVIDTGGWFRIGCPTSRIAKPEVLGGIYRVRRRAAARIEDPRGLTLAWRDATPEALIARLNDERPAVRDRALRQLSQHGELAVAHLASAVSGGSQATRPSQRTLAVWALARIETDSARSALRAALADPDLVVRQAAVHGLWSQRDVQALDPLLDIVASEAAASLRREAAAALGRLGRAEAVPVLLDAVRRGADRFLEHALLYALIQIADREATLAGLADTNPQVRRAALIALDQMREGNLQREQVAPLLDTDDVALQQSVLQVMEKHAGWAAETMGLLTTWLAEPELGADREQVVRGALLAFGHDAAVQTLVASTLANDETPQPTRLLLLEVISRGELAQTPETWVEQIRRHLGAKDASLVRQAVLCASALHGDELDSELLAVSNNSHLEAELRASALGVLCKHGASLNETQFAFLVSRLDEDVAPIERLAAAASLASAKLNASQRLTLTERVAQAGPLELPVLLDAFEKVPDSRTALALLQALDASQGLEALAPTRLVTLFAGYSPEIIQQSEALSRRLNVDVAEQRARISSLVRELAPGDAARGRLVFFGKKTSCSACHRIRGEGGNVGPDLSKIGQIRTRLDLLESVLYPSASLARGFETYSIATTGGQIHSGLVSRETADAVYLRTAQRDEIRVPRQEIEELSPSRQSVMPQGLDKLMGLEELADVLAFLQSLKE